MKPDSSTRLLQTILLSSILLLSYSLRLWRVAVPDTYYFDEVYHAFTAAYYAANMPQAYEWWHQAPEGVAFEWLHPPLAKLIQGLSIFLLGDYSFAWRLPSVIFGVLVVAAVYHLAQVLFKDRWLSLLSALFASIEGLLIVQSRIAMNDIFVTLFMLLAFARYYHFRFSHPRGQLDLRWFLETCLLLGLAISSKWSAVFAWATIWFVEAINSRPVSIKPLQLVVGWFLTWFGLPAILVLLMASNHEVLFQDTPFWLTYALVVVLAIHLISSLLLPSAQRLRLYALGLIPVVVYVASFGQFWLQSRDSNLTIFRQLHHQIVWYQTHLEATHPWQSTPVEWLLNLKPVWFYVDYQEGVTGHIFALANPVIAWIGPIALLVLLVWRQKIRRPGILYLSLIYLAVWLPWIVSPRIMFYYHYTPAMALLCVGLAALVRRMYLTGHNLLVGLSLTLVLLVVAASLFFYPMWTGLMLPNSWWEYYFWFDSWRPY